MFAHDVDDVWKKPKIWLFQLERCYRMRRNGVALRLKLLDALIHHHCKCSYRTHKTHTHTPRRKAVLQHSCRRRLLASRPWCISHIHGKLMWKSIFLIVLEEKFSSSILLLLFYGSWQHKVFMVFGDAHSFDWTFWIPFTTHHSFPHTSTRRASVVIQRNILCWVWFRLISAHMKMENDDYYYLTFKLVLCDASLFAQTINKSERTTGLRPI